MPSRGSPAPGPRPRPGPRSRARPGPRPERIGIGTDIVPVARIAALVRDRGDRFLDRWFTPAEIEYCRRKADPSRHLAARFAAKEAVVKALATTWDGPLAWRCIEVVPQAGGAPSVRLSGSVLDAADREGVSAIRVSLSHCIDYATAVAVCRSGREDLDGLHS